MSRVMSSYVLEKNCSKYNKYIEYIRTFRSITILCNQTSGREKFSAFARLKLRPRNADNLSISDIRLLKIVIPLRDE